MSVYRTDYVIYGYDLSEYKAEFDEAICENEKLVPESLIKIEKWCTFSDCMDDTFFYFGYLIAEGDYSEGFRYPIRITFEEIEKLASVPSISDEFRSIIDKLSEEWPEMLAIEPQLIVFSDWR